MAVLTSAPQVREVPYTGIEIKCPVCDYLVDISAVVEISEGSVRTAGRTGRQAVLSVDVRTEVKKIRIKHECDVQAQED